MGKKDKRSCKNVSKLSCKKDNGQLSLYTCDTFMLLVLMSQQMSIQIPDCQKLEPIVRLKNVKITCIRFVSFIQHYWVIDNRVIWNKAYEFGHESVERIIVIEPSIRRLKNLTIWDLYVAKAMLFEWYQTLGSVFQPRKKPKKMQGFEYHRKMKWKIDRYACIPLFQYNQKSPEQSR